MRHCLATLALLVSLDALAAERAPVLVELFTSEGCSSCPPADEALLKLAREQPISGAEVVPLELHVDYWDNQGWVDPFSMPEATARQQQYAAAAAKAGAAGQLYTPQMVVDGTRSFIGSLELVGPAVAQASALPMRQLRADVRPAPGGVDVELHLGPGEDKPATVWVVLTESGLSSRVKSGENAGRTLTHAPVVRLLEKAAVAPGSGWTGTVRLVFARTWHRQALGVVAFAQDGQTGRVVGVSTTPVPGPQAAGESASTH